MRDDQSTIKALQACLDWLRNNSDLTIKEWTDEKSLDVAAAAAEVVFACNPPERRLEFDQHFRPDADLVVFDRKLGTIGLFVSLPNRPNDADVLTAIEQAAYLRHLCLVKAAPVEPATHAWTVELVLLLAAEQRGEVQTWLGEVLRDSEYLYGIGVHLLSVADDAAIADACCWLLPQTRRWFAALPPRAATPRPVSLTLKNWRLPGERTIGFADKPTDQARVQLIHGPNGSGKSSLVEALEALTTGKIERLNGCDPNNVLPNIDNPTCPATVTLKLNTNDQTFDWKSDQENISRLPTDAFMFCINQKTMIDFVGDSYSYDNKYKRASKFIETFYQQYKNICEEREKSKRFTVESFNKLPKWLQTRNWPIPSQYPAGFDQSDVMMESLYKRHMEKAPIKLLPPALQNLFNSAPPEDQRKMQIVLPENLYAYLEMLNLLPQPSDRQDLFALFSMASDRTKRPSQAECDHFDAPWRALSTRLNKLGDELVRARQILESDTLRRWQAKADVTITAHKPLVILQDWAETETLRLILHRQWVTNTVLAAQPMPWPDSLRVLAAAADGDGTGRTRLRERRDAARQKAGDLRTAWAKPEGDKSGEGTASVPELDAAAQQCLDRLSDLFGLPSDQPGLGQALRRALNERQVVAAGPYVLGSGDWTAPLLNRLNQLDDVCRALGDETLAPATVGLRILEFADQAAQFCMSVDQVMTAFNTEVRKIYNGPLRELIAASTPARWAYPNIDGEIEAQQANHTMNIRFGSKQEGELNLNTAELNVFVVMLFLLCAPRRTDNPWGLLVFDDPLQNMDELTVTALARSVARVARLLDPSWLVLMLFHGADDFARMATEIPAATLRLPWIRSVGADKKPETPDLNPAPTGLADLAAWVGWAGAGKAESGSASPQSSMQR